MSEALYAAAKLYNDPKYFNKSEIRIRKNKIKRERIYRRNMIILFSIIFIIFMSIILSITSIKSDAKITGNNDVKYYKTISINTGDSLWQIAEDNISYAHYKDINAYISEIKKLNKLGSDDITQGNDIIIPYYSSEIK
ncbi:MAG: LysM peptidoglycan-binding domain-containing protein [Butyrivibrio sp.]|nr:LysM peptidoglycan-binding domain-containing protein [Butyrivibrio sp.]